MPFISAAFLFVLQTAQIMLAVNNNRANGHRWTSHKLVTLSLSQFFDILISQVDFESYPLALISTELCSSLKPQLYQLCYLQYIKNYPSFSVNLPRNVVFLEFNINHLISSSEGWRNT